MCDGGVIIAAVGAIYGAYTTKKNADRQERALVEAQKVDAEENFRQISTEADDRIKAARAERARLRAMSAESGVSGLAIDEILGNVDMQMGVDLARLEQNGMGRERASRANLNSNLNRIEQPDYAGAAL